MKNVLSDVPVSSRGALLAAPASFKAAERTYAKSQPLSGGGRYR